MIENNMILGKNPYEEYRYEECSVCGFNIKNFVYCKIIEGYTCPEMTECKNIKKQGDKRCTK